MLTEKIRFFYSRLVLGGLLLVAVIMSSDLRAEGPPERKTGTDGKKPGIREQLVQKNHDISKDIDWLAKKIDLFLAGEEITDKPNPSSIVIRNSSFFSEGGEFDNSVHFDVNLRLPNLEKKWQLKFTSYDETEEDRGISRNQFRTEPRETNYGASVGLIRKLGDIDMNFQPRIELRDPLEVSYIWEFESEAKYENYRLKPRLELFARPDKGTGVFSSVSYLYELSEAHEFEFVVDGEYQDKENLFTASQAVIFRQAIGEDAGFAYTLAAESNSRPSYHLEKIGVFVTWGHMLYHDVFKYELTPGVRFRKDDDFKGDVNFRLTLSVIF